MELSRNSSMADDVLTFTPTSGFKLKSALVDEPGDSSVEQIKMFKAKVNAVTDKYLAKIKESAVAGTLPTYARIVIKLMVELTGREVFLALV